MEALLGLNPAVLGGGLAALAALLLAFLGVKGQARKRGQAEGREQAQQERAEQVDQHNAAVQQQNAEVVKQVEQTHEVHDRLDADPAYRQRVRDRFTRSD